jgi:hypothetical protein
MKHKTATTAFIATAFLAAGHLPAQEKADAAKTAAYQTSVSQEQLKSMTKRLKTEMLGLLDEFNQYQIASGELGKLKEAMGQLDTVTEKDMAAVIRILREASRAEKLDDAKSKLVEASGGQKEIQALLRSVADRLTLQKEESAIKQRLDQLALRQLANLRETKRLAESGEKPEKVKWDLQKARDVAKAEQEALKKEVRMATDTLKDLAEKSDSPEKEAFKAAADQASKDMLNITANDAAEKMKTDFAEAAKDQEAMAKSLQQMVNGLQSRKTAEEQTRELAEQMKQLAEKQEQLAKSSPSDFEYKGSQMKKEQEEVADKLQMAKDALAKLNPEAAAKSEDARQQAEQVAKDLKDKKALERADNIAKVADAQSQVAEKLDEAAKMLEKQADALAAAENPQGSESQQQEASEMSPQEAAIADAVNQVMDAKNQMELAKRQLEQNGNQQDAKQRLDKAEAALDSAREQVANVGEVPKNVGEELKNASDNAAKAEQGIGVGDKQEQQKSRWNLDRAQDNASRALAGLQQAANQLAAQQAQQKSQQQAQQKSQQKSQQQGQQMPSQGEAGGPIPTRKETTDISAVSKTGSGQREALSLLQQEKAPTEYEAMVQQYIRNLAESANQGQ